MIKLKLKKAQIKKLPLGSPFIFEKRYWQDCIKKCQQIEPVFGSNGFYYDRHKNRTWIEVNGEAWLYAKPKNWKFDYDHQGEIRIHPKVYDAIQVLIKWNAASPEQHKAQRIEHNIRYFRQLRINARLNVMKSMNKKV